MPDVAWPFYFLDFVGFSSIFEFSSRFLDSWVFFEIFGFMDFLRCLDFLCGFSSIFWIYGKIILISVLYIPLLEISVHSTSWHFGTFHFLKFRYIPLLEISLIFWKWHDFKGRYTSEKIRYWVESKCVG